MKIKLNLDNCCANTANLEQKVCDFLQGKTSLPAGGTAGQVLTKVDSTDYNAEWANASSGTSTNTTLGAASVRQTVLDGLLDSSGFPACITSGTGLQIIIKANIANPLVITAADGFGASGAIDYTMELTSDANVNVAANSTNYIYAEYDKSTQAWNFGATTIAPTYARSGTPFFNTAKMKVVTGNPMVYIGEITTDITSITGVVTYAYRGEYDSGLFAVSANAIYTKNHNIGIHDFDTTCFIADDANGTNKRNALDLLANGNYNYGHLPSIADRKIVAIKFFNNLAIDINGAGIMNGYYQVKCRRSW